MTYSEHNDNVLKSALNIYLEKYLNTLPSDEKIEAIRFSKSFEKRMEKLIGYQKKPYYVLINSTRKQIACVVVAVIMVLTTITFSVEAFRTPVVNFIVETYEKFSAILFNNNGAAAETTKDTLDNLMLPSYIPEEYELTHKERHVFSYFVEYSNVNDEASKILFTQFTLKNFSIDVDTEGTTTETIQIGGITGIYYENKGVKSIVWNDGEYAYTLDGDISKDELVRIAESLKMEEK